MPDFAQLDPSQLVTIVFGATIKGYGDGTFITPKRTADLNTTSVGAAGDVVKVKVLDQSGEIELVLQQTSESNDVLSAFAALDTIGPVLIKDLGGTTLITATNAWMKKLPDPGYGKDLQTRTWVISCAELVMFVGGNP